MRICINVYLCVNEHVSEHMYLCVPSCMSECVKVHVYAGVSMYFCMCGVCAYQHFLDAFSATEVLLMNSATELSWLPAL